MVDISLDRKLAYLREQVRILKGALAHGLSPYPTADAADLATVVAILADYAHQSQPALFPEEKMPAATLRIGKERV